MVNQQKGVQQDTAYSAVVVNDHMYPVHAYIIFSCCYDPFGDIGTGIPIHCNCSILLHSFLLIYHPYPPSFHEMIFTLVSLIFLR